VPFAVQWPVVALGIGIGALVAATFSLLPLLADTRHLAAARTAPRRR
jgi:hypothetical protein